MSWLLPRTLVWRMILFENLFALLYGFLWEQCWPTGLEAGAFMPAVLSVTSCIAAQQRVKAPNPTAATARVTARSCRHRRRIRRR
ncbi:hypothetical protein [uncultured Sphingomonas sp.]|uniref:hypothetical protein n=1 Tax=uncultured Sphingomonas sp. TaxID=158754 RepID=UPI0026305DA8|nr:hypothetical protein [uncultured Sphingomonas sp.]